MFLISNTVPVPFLYRIVENCTGLLDVMSGRGEPSLKGLDKINTPTGKQLLNSDIAQKLGKGTRGVTRVHDFLV